MVSEKLYHATYCANLEGIQEQGLVPGQRKNWGDCEDGFVYLADDPEVAISFCETAEDVSEEVYESRICCFEVDVGSLDGGRLVADPNILEYEEIESGCHGYAGSIPYQSLKLISMEELLGDSFRVRNPAMIGDIFHVGTMDISKKRRHSHEGDGLSISNCPDEWVAVTEGFTYGDYFKLSKPDMKLLDYYGLTDGERTEIQCWALENGYIQEGKLYKSITWGEDGEEYFSLFDSYEKALYEADEEVDRVEAVDGLIPTQNLMDQSLVKIELLQVRDIVTALYAEQVLGYDGIWWDEELDVSAYSAPRGVIFNGKLSSFNVENTSMAQPALDDVISEIEDERIGQTREYSPLCGEREYAP